MVRRFAERDVGILHHQHELDRAGRRRRPGESRRDVRPPEVPAVLRGDRGAVLEGGARQLEGLGRFEVAAGPGEGVVAGAAASQQDSERIRHGIP
ncbi:hypothetical protein AX769_07430 [Frondihabitans sp. PAMC 28766]|nr:hypothetical protein AX769_07430 [Frondihabitans sp. PAMC 28766]